MRPGTTPSYPSWTTSSELELDDDDDDDAWDEEDDGDDED